MATVSKWGGEKLVVDGGHAQLVALADGRYALSYMGLNSPSDLNVQVFGKIFNADAKLAKSFAAHPIDASLSHNFPAATALANGGLAFAWEAFNSSTFDDVHLRIVDGAGKLTGSETIANTTTFDGQISASMTTLANGNFVVAFSDWSNFPSEARAQIFAPDGAKVGTEFKLNGTPTDALDPVPTVTALSNGNFVALWEDDGEDGSSASIRGQVFTSAGAATADAEFRVNTTTNGRQADAAASALSEGKFVVVWTDDQNPSFNEAGNKVYSSLVGQLFNADGTKAAGEFTIAPNTSGNQSDASVATLNDGRFVVVWTNATGNIFEGPTPDSTISAAIYNADGSVSVDAFKVNTASAGQQSQSSVAVLEDGRVVFSWLTDDAGKTKDGIYTQIYDPRTAGVVVAGSDGLGDQLIGSKFADTFNGLGGKDKLDGAGGKDTLTGGAGVDLLTGGKQDDRFVFSAASDSGIGKNKRDVITDFNAASSKEKIDLSALSDKTFKWKGDGAFSTKADVEVRYKFEGANKTIVEIDLDKDRAAEMQIELTGHFDLGKGDFIL